MFSQVVCRNILGEAKSRSIARFIWGAHEKARHRQADEARFFSYRRSTHRGETDYGRLISAIALEA